MVPLILLALILSFISWESQSLPIGIDRKTFTAQSLNCVLLVPTTATAHHSSSENESSFAQASNLHISHPFKYNDDWSGTDLSLKTLSEAVDISNQSMDGAHWPMARWPDPILRRPADEVSLSYFGTPKLVQTCQILAVTAQREGAVGLAAQQCAVNARIIYLHTVSRRQPALILINPLIVQRSPESSLRVWREECLVLPPTFRATVLRDAWIDVEYQTIQGLWKKIRLDGERSRALQHEMDHDRGILITDHVSLDELESSVMRSIEAPGHDQRQRQAYERYVSDRQIV
jgi:peptide deformylase